LVGAVGQPIMVLKDVLIMTKRNEWFDAICTAALIGRALTYWLGSVSMCTLTVISIDRFLAIKLKASYPNVVTLKRISAFPLLWWVVGGVLFLYFFFFSNVELKTVIILLSIAMTCLLSIITISYYKAVKLMKTLMAKTSPKDADGQTCKSSHFDISKYQKSLKTMSIVFSAIMAFYLPHFIAVLVIAASPNGYEKNILKYNLAACAEVLLLANSTLNPLLYLWRMRDLREAAKTSLRRLFGRNRINVCQN
jgi:hypothetical protein